MNIKVLIIGLVGLISITPVFAQKGELSNALDQFNRYSDIYRSKALAAMATTVINEAKGSIDKASVNEKTAAVPLTYAVKGAIHLNDNTQSLHALATIENTVSLLPTTYPTPY